MGSCAGAGAVFGSAGDGAGAFLQDWWQGAGGVLFGGAARCCFGVWRFCKIDGGHAASGAVGGAVRGAGVQSSACFLLSGVYAGVFFCFFFLGGGVILFWGGGGGMSSFPLTATVVPFFWQGVFWAFGSVGRKLWSSSAQNSGEGSSEDLGISWKRPREGTDS